MIAEAVLAGKRIAVLIEDGFEDAEVTGPVEALRGAGADVVIIGPLGGREYTGRLGTAIAARVAAGRARMREFDALVIPGGHAPDRMRLRHPMVDLARDAMESGKIVGAISHGPQLLISANVLRNRTLTCWPSIAIDVKNAGGRYCDRPVTVDGNLVTSRKADDVPAFSSAIVELLARPDHRRDAGDHSSAVLRGD